MSSACVVSIRHHPHDQSIKQGSLSIDTTARRNFGLVRFLLANAGYTYVQRRAKNEHGRPHEMTGISATTAPAKSRVKPRYPTSEWQNDTTTNTLPEH
ncbi:hypothetical protein BM1_04258 [Bipolaris maydis]|nr:hypothetical protein BM1_04258 [Bipolaris maydis]